MKKDSPEIAGYAVLPLQLPPTPAFPKPATHYLYLRPHEPRIPDADSPRSLFVVNVPIDSTEIHLRHLFSKQLAAGRVETVHFEDVPTKKKHGHASTTQGSNISQSRKRKRLTADDLQNQLDEIELPSTWDRQLQKSGSHAIVVFVDKPSMEAGLKAATKAAKKGSGQTIVWGQGAEHRVPELGLARYQTHQSKQYPDRAALLRTVNDYMVVFTQVAEARKREESRKAQEPDDDGFVTVTSGPKLNSVAHEDETRELVERQKKKAEGLEDFYRFQSREKRKERQNELLKKFGEDRKKLDEVKKRKGKFRALKGYKVHVQVTTSPTSILSYISSTTTALNIAMTTDRETGGGGFIQPSIPSPSPAPSSMSTSTTTPSHLPRQRTHPLKAGSMKETTVINHLDKSILAVNRRHAKKFSSAYEGVEAQNQAQGQGSERGYESFKEMVRDVEGLVDVVWVSGTPSLQIPYMISLAVLVNSSLSDYPFSPRSTFRLLRKLDSVFASLLLGEDVESGAPLPGFETRRNVVSMTEKVRIKSIAETCRMVVMEVRGRDEDEEEEDGDGSGDGGESDEEDEDMVDVLGNGAGAGLSANGNGNEDEYRETPGRWEMEAARVYERTIQLLGDELGKQGEFGDDITAECG